MIRKTTLLILIGAFCLASKAQYLDNKMDVGIGVGILLPLNSADLNRDGVFVYPSLFGNFPFGTQLNTFLNYHLTPSVYLGIQVEHIRMNAWVGNQDIFILTQPSLLMNNLSVSTHYLPGILQTATPNFKWGFYLAPVLSYQQLEWDEMVQDADNQLSFSNNTLSAGIRAGISFFAEVSNMNGLRFDLYYQYMKTENDYYLDHSFHSLNASLAIFFKLLKNRNFRYD